MKALRTVASALNLLLLIIGVIVVISAVMSRNDFVLIVILVAVGLFLVGTGWINRRALKQEDTTRNPGFVLYFTNSCLLLIAIVRLIGMVFDKEKNGLPLVFQLTPVLLILLPSVLTIITVQKSQNRTSSK